MIHVAHLTLKKSVLKGTALAICLAPVLVPTPANAWVADRNCTAPKATAQAFASYDPNFTGGTCTPKDAASIAKLPWVKYVNPTCNVVVIGGTCLLGTDEITNHQYTASFNKKTGLCDHDFVVQDGPGANSRKEEVGTCQDTKP